MGLAQTLGFALLLAIALDAALVMSWHRIRRARRSSGEPQAPEPTADSTGVGEPGALGGRSLESPEPQAVPPPAGPPIELGILLLGGGLMVGVGQLALPLLGVERRWESYTLTALGLLSFFVAVRGFGAGRLPSLLDRVLSGAGRWLGVSRLQALLLAFSPLLSASVWLAAGDEFKMRFGWLAVGLWLASIALVVLGSRRPQAAARDPEWTTAEFAAVWGLVLLAFLVRGIWLTQIPWVFTGDEGSAGLSAVDFVQGTQDNIFNTAWFSFPSLFFFLESLSIRVLGQTIEAARLPAALVGALTVAGLYWFARPAFGRGVALAGAAYLATFPFHIHFSRTGLNNIWDGLSLVIVSGGLWRAWARDWRPGFVIAGLALGIGQYFYPSVRVLFVVIPLWLVGAFLKDRRQFRERLPGLAILLLAVLATALPLILFYLRHPQEFAAPLSRVSILGQWLRNEMELRESGPLPILWQQFKASSLAFSTLDMRGHFNDAPMLLTLPAVLFLLGLAITLARIRSLENLWLALWVLASVAVGALSESTPTSQRYLFAAPAVALLVAVPLMESARWLAGLWPRWKRLAAVGFASLLVLAMVKDVTFYFGDYSANRSFGDLNTETATGVAFYLQSLGPDQTVYFFGPPRMGFSTHNSIPYLVPDADGVDVIDPLIGPPEWPLDKSTAFIFLPERREELEWVRARYPDGVPQVFLTRNGDPLFIGYAVDVP